MAKRAQKVSSQHVSTRQAPPPPRQAPDQQTPQRQGAYPCGAQSRQRLVDTAIDVFGNLGFDGASTRLLAQKAGVNLSAIPYYFGSKEGLYKAAAEHIATGAAAKHAPAIAKAQAALQDPALTRNDAMAVLQDMLVSVAAILLGADGNEHWVRFVTREQMDPTPAFDILYNGMLGPIHNLCTALVAKILDQAQDDEDTLIRTTAILGQIIVFRTARATALRRLDWETFTQHRIDAILEVVRKQTRAILSDTGA